MTQFQNSNLGGDFIPKTTPKVEVKLRSFQEDAEIFKEKFGKDYVSPFEKYDLHLPRSSILGGPDSMEERLHKKNDYKSMRNLTKIFLVLSALSVTYFLSVLKKSAEEAELDKKQKLVNAVNKQLILERFSQEYERRKKISEELKKSH